MHRKNPRRVLAALRLLLSATYRASNSDGMPGEGLLTIGFRRHAKTTSYDDIILIGENENASTIYGHYRARR